MSPRSPYPCHDAFQSDCETFHSRAFPLLTSQSVKRLGRKGGQLVPLIELRWGLPRHCCAVKWLNYFRLSNELCSAALGTLLLGRKTAPDRHISDFLAFGSGHHEPIKRGDKTDKVHEC